MTLTPEDMGKDFADWLQVCILGRSCTPQELDQIMTKSVYWWTVATLQRDALNRAHSLN